MPKSFLPSVKMPPRNGNVAKLKCTFLRLGTRKYDNIEVPGDLLRMTNKEHLENSLKNHMPKKYR